MIIGSPIVSGFDLFGFNIRIYSVCMFLAIALAFIFVYYSSGRLSLKTSKDVILDFFPWLFLSGVFGARLYYVLLCHEYYFLNPHLIFQIWTGGISIHGAFLGGIIAGVIYFKYKKIKFFPYADICSTGLALGQAVGRWGNYFNQEAFGAPITGNFPIKLFVDSSFRPFEYQNNDYFHPVFLYESIFDFLIFLILIFSLKKSADKYDGFVFFAYIFLYSFVRAFLELIRLDSVLFINSLPFPFLVSVFGIFAGVLGMIYRLRAH